MNYILLVYYGSKEKIMIDPILTIDDYKFPAEIIVRKLNNVGM